VFSLCVWGLLTIACFFPCCAMCWGTILSLRTQPENALLIFSGAFLTGSMAIYTAAWFYHVWRWGDFPESEWMGRLTGVTGWMWVVYFGLLVAGLGLMEGGSLFFLFAGLAVTLFGILGACRTATRPADLTDPIFCQLRQIESWYRENLDDEEQVRRVMEKLCELTQSLEWDEEWYEVNEEG
jgi:hypothetical protein